MKTIKNIGGILFFVLSIGLVQAQEPEKTGNSGTTQEVDKKAQNNNTVKSNRNEGKLASEQAESNSNSSSATSKKGYDYYKAKSDMNAAGMHNNPKSQTPDHNSSRSNKTSSPVAVENTGGTGTLGEKKTNKK